MSMPDLTGMQIEEAVVHLEKFNIPEGTDPTPEELAEMEPAEILDIENGEIVKHVIRDEDGDVIVLVDRERDRAQQLGTPPNKGEK